MLRAEGTRDPTNSLMAGSIEQPLSSRARGVAAVIGVAAAAVGVTAVFLSDNQAGTAALFVIAAIFLSCADFGLKPRSIAIQGATVDLTPGQAATVDSLGRDPDVAEKVLAAYDAQLASRNRLDSSPPLPTGGLNATAPTLATAVADVLRESGWSASTPPTARYVLWTYRGRTGSASLYQNPSDLAVSRAELRALVDHLPGAEIRPRETRFSFFQDQLDQALAAAECLRSWADAN